MTIANDGNLTPPEHADPCHVCGEPVAYPTDEYRDVHDDCKEADCNV